MTTYIGYRTHPLLAEFDSCFKSFEAAVTEAFEADRQRKQTYSERISWDSILQKFPTTIALDTAAGKAAFAKYQQRDEADHLAFCRVSAAQHGLYEAMAVFYYGAMRTLAFHLGGTREPEINKSFDPYKSKDKPIDWVPGLPRGVRELPLLENLVPPNFAPYELSVAQINFAAAVQLFKSALHIHDSMNRLPGNYSPWASYRFNEAFTWFQTIPALRVRESSASYDNPENCA